MKYASYAVLSRSLPFDRIRETLFDPQVGYKSEEGLKGTGIEKVNQDWPAFFRATALVHSTENRLQALTAGLDHGLRRRANVSRFLQAFREFIIALGQPGPLDERKQVLRTYNAFVSRAVALNSASHPQILAHGLFLGAYARSTQALWHYAQLAKDHGIKLESKDFHSTIEEVFSWCEDINNFPERHSQRTKAEIHQLLTGRNLLHPGQEDNTFRNLFDLTEDHHSWNFFKAIGKLSGPEELHRTWSAVSQKLAHLKTGESSAVYQNMANRAIQSLVSAGGAQQAWRVVQDLGWDVSCFHKDTWTLLLDSPEYITEWKPGMEELVLEKYDRALGEIEEAFGVVWTGGVEGCHRFVDEELKEEFEEVAGR